MTNRSPQQSMQCYKCYIVSNPLQSSAAAYYQLFRNEDEESQAVGLCVCMFFSPLRINHFRFCSSILGPICEPRAFTFTQDLKCNLHSNDERRTMLLDAAAFSFLRIDFAFFLFCLAGQGSGFPLILHQRQSDQQKLSHLHDGALALNQSINCELL